MSRRTLRWRSSACRDDDPHPRRRKCQDYRFHRTETYPSIRPKKPRCDPHQDEAITRLGTSLVADGCGRPFEMVKDDVLLAWRHSPHKDTLGFYGVGSPTHQPESVVFNRVLADCLVKVSSVGTRQGRPKKTISTPPRVSPTGTYTSPQLCKPFILNRQALQSELQLMPYVKQQLKPGKAFETIYCPDPPDPSDPFGVKQQLQTGRDFKPKKVQNGLRRRPWYCPMDCDEARNGCTQYEWARYKLDPRPHNKEFRDWLQDQRESKSTEPKDYDQLYERFLKCFEQKPPDPLCKIYEECCKTKKSRKEDNQGGGDGHRGNGDGQQPEGPGESPPDLGTPNDGDSPGTGKEKEKEKEDNEKGINEGADGTGDKKDKEDGSDNNKVVEKDKHKNITINEDKDKENIKERVVEKEKNKDINKDKDKDISKDQDDQDDDDEFKNIDKNKNENKNKNKNRHKNKKKNKNEEKVNEEKVNEDENFKMKKRKPESDVTKKEIPKGNIPSEAVPEMGRPSVIPYTPSEKNSDRPSKVEATWSDTELEPPVKDYHKFVPVIPKDKIKVPPKKKKNVRNKNGDKNEKIEKIKKVCQPCPPQGCQCEICHFMDRQMEPEAPFMRNMRRVEQKRQLRAYYRQMCHREYLQNRCREEYRAPRHKCDPICCENFLCRNPQLAEHCDCLGAVQDLQKLISGYKDNKDCSRLLHRIENLRRRVCQRMCDCILG